MKGNIIFYTRFKICVPLRVSESPLNCFFELDFSAVN